MVNRLMLYGRILIGLFLFRILVVYVCLCGLKVLWFFVG